MPPSFVRFIIVLSVCLFAASTVRAEDGLYADFTTSLGSFTCKLAYDVAPRTVANFVGLATGERSWLDLKTGEVASRPFYNGLIFHRVVGGFVIQAGSPAGNGTDGPGYTFQDEFSPTLRHNKAGVLSMANSGPHSNGSQFFVTLAAEPDLDDVHSIFGEVTSGMDVVNAIGAVPVNGGGKPLTDVVINSVTIRREGAAAQAFDLSMQGLPTVSGAGAVLTKAGASYALQFPRALYSDYFVYATNDLATWTKQRLELYVTPPPSGDFDLTSLATGQSRQFYRVPRIAYPGPLFTPPSLAGRQLIMNLNDNTDTLILNFNTVGGGTATYVENSSTGTITLNSWRQEAYRGFLSFASTNLYRTDVSLVFTSPTAGTLKGVYRQDPLLDLTGTFTLSTP